MFLKKIKKQPRGSPLLYRSSKHRSSNSVAITLFISCRHSPLESDHLYGNNQSEGLLGRLKSAARTNIHHRQQAPQRAPELHRRRIQQVQKPTAEEPLAQLLPVRQHQPQRRFFPEW